MTDYLKLKMSNCKNCYKCIRHCSVKAISFANNQASIVTEECILCGQCFVVCPQNTKEIKDNLLAAQKLLSGNEHVYASIAPSFVANYAGVSIKSMKKALLALGFYDVEETAVGATIVKKQYEKLIRDREQDVIISSCCHTVNLLIQKHYPEALPYLAKVLSPMQAHCMAIKNRDKKAKAVFIGPCISKMAEADAYPGIVDCVLTFDDLSRWLEASEISFESIADDNDKTKARLFPTAGGILRTMDTRNSDYGYMAVDGIDSCIAALKDLIAGNIHHCFIEMSACKDSCIGGPVRSKHLRAPVREYIAVNSYAGSTDFPVAMSEQHLLHKDFLPFDIKQSAPDSTLIEEVLRKMGKTKPEHELNCGSCGYDTCREKAAAIINGKADLTMCLPYLMEKSVSFSDNIIHNTPNGIIVLNEELKVQQINKAAQNILRIGSPEDILGQDVVLILPPDDFYTAMEMGKNIYKNRIYLTEYRTYIEQTTIYDKVYHIIMVIMRDVTHEETERERKEQISQQTIETADKVINKQMRAVQEIASVLGETTAEIKIALTNLKESLHGE